MATQSPRDVTPNHNDRDEVLKRMLKMKPKPRDADKDVRRARTTKRASPKRSKA